MSIWGKIIGGTAGFALGGPIGAILGVMAGNIFDKSKKSRFNFNQISNNQKQNIFALSIIILCAKIAKSDGVVTKDEIEAFKEKFNIPKEEISQVSKIFNEAKKSTYDFKNVADQVGQLFLDNKIAFHNSSKFLIPFLISLIEIPQITAISDESRGTPFILQAH